MKTVLSKPALLKKLIRKETLVVPGAFNAASAMLVEQCGFKAVYMSGAGISNSAGFPDIGLLTMEEFAQQAGYIAHAVDIPVIADADTGFGGPINVARTLQEFEKAGIAAIQIEDQVMPKRCGHLSGKEIVSVHEMIEKIESARDARRDKDFLIIARTDARSVSGLDDAIERGKRYVDAGADVIFPEALESKEEFREFAKKVKALLMANMTDFGKTPYITVKEFESMGYALVLFPMTAFRIAMNAMKDALSELKAKGTQKGMLNEMQTREELYKLLKYKER